MVPSEACAGLLSGRGTACPYPQPPAGLAKDHNRVALTAQGVCYAVLAQVGTLEATPAFRLSAAVASRSGSRRQSSREGLALDGSRGGL